MAIFQSNTCAAFTWDDQDVFRGVLIERDGDSFRVKNYWQTEKIGNRSRAQIMEQGLSPLDVSEDTTIIVGGNFTKSCFIDLKLPKISHSDLRNALRFELSKHSPTPLEDIQWGYRIIGKIPGTETNLVRVIYFPQPEWEAWVAAASGINNGVDLIIPATAVLDPIVGEKDACFDSTNNGNEFYLFRSLEGGERQIVCLAPNTPLEATFGTGENPLSIEGFDAAELGELSPEKQKGFAPSILLGLYGVTDTFYHDRKHWLPVPLEMRPRRNRGLKIYTMSVIFYLLLLIILLVSFRLYNNHHELKKLDAESRRIQAEIDKLESPDDAGAFGDEFQDELKEVNASMHSMARVVLELTKLVNEKLWCTNFNWDSGDIRIELRSEAEDPDLSATLERSRHLADITMNKRQISSGVNYSINCRVKIPDDEPIREEKPALDSDEDESEEEEYDLEEQEDFDDENI